MTQDPLSITISDGQAGESSNEVCLDVHKNMAVLDSRHCLLSGPEADSQVDCLRMYHTMVQV